MDAILPALFSAAPQLGVAGVLLFVLGLVMRRESADRTDYRAALESAAKRHTEEVDRMRKGHDEEIAELKADLAQLEAKLGELQNRLDLEREARRKAEDMAAEVRRNPREWPS